MRNLYIIIILAGIISCKKQTGNLPTAQLNEYMPMFVGKYIHYQLDSMVFIHLGQKDTVISYEAKDIVDGELTDGEGNLTYRVIRYLRELGSMDESDYVPKLTYFVTPTKNSVELIENNLRYQKLKLPVTEGFNWRGNTYLPDAPFYTLYEFSNDIDIHEWNYTYFDVNQSIQIGNNVYDSTASVLQVADSSNVPIEFPDGLAYKNYWTEVYAKNVGLIYKEIEMWEYQPANESDPSMRSGFGLKMTIIDHN